MTEILRRNYLKTGLAVEIEATENQGTDSLPSRTIAEILTASKRHFHGIKARLWDRRINKVTYTAPEAQARSLADLDAKSMPKTEDNEFKEFCQYDVRIWNLASVGGMEHRKAVERITRSVRGWFAAAVCALGKDNSEGFVHLGVRTDGLAAGLERDKKVGNFADCNDSFANRISDTLEIFLRDRAFILSNRRMRFWRADGKTTCTVQMLPADRPLYLHAIKGQTFYVRCPAPRAVRLADAQERCRHIGSRFLDCR